MSYQAHRDPTEVTRALQSLVNLNFYHSLRAPEPMYCQPTEATLQILVNLHSLQARVRRRIFNSHDSGQRHPMSRAEPPCGQKKKTI